MGTLTLPPSGTVYLDTSPIIYTVEKHTDFFPLLKPLWLAGQAGQLAIVSSELALLETFTGPLKQNDAALLQMYEATLKGSEVILLPITENVLRTAARVRAQTNLKTPDAIHAASALSVGCAQFITNDPAFKRLPQVNVTVLSEII